VSITGDIKVVQSFFFPDDRIILSQLILLNIVID
jgi:hypothetical protein